MPSVAASPPYVLAGRWSRLLNFVVDWISYTVLSFLIGIVLALAGFAERLATMTRLEEFALGLLLLVLYYVGFEASFGWTVGKLVSGTRVVDERGARPSFGKVLGRTLARLVPFEPFSIFGGEPVAWHDRWAGTRVVSIRSSNGIALADSVAAKNNANDEKLPQGWAAMSEAEKAVWQMRQTQAAQSSRPSAPRPAGHA